MKMKRMLCLLLTLALSFCLPMLSFATTPEEESSDGVGTLVWGILATVLFCVGMFVIYKWDKKIKQRDAQFEEELEKHLEESGENGEDADGAEDSDGTEDSDGAEGGEVKDDGGEGENAGNEEKKD